MRGHLAAKTHRCSVPGHGHAHMGDAPDGYVCEVVAESNKPPNRTMEKRLARLEIDDDLGATADPDDGRRV